MDFFIQQMIQLAFLLQEKLGQPIKFLSFVNFLKKLFYSGASALSFTNVPERNSQFAATLLLKMTVRPRYYALHVPLVEGCWLSETPWFEHRDAKVYIPTRSFAKLSTTFNDDNADYDATINKFMWNFRKCGKEGFLHVCLSWYKLPKSLRPWRVAIWNMQAHICFVVLRPVLVCNQS